MGKRYGASFETLREEVEEIRPAESIRRPPRLESARTNKGSQSGRQVMTGRSLTLTEAGNDLDNFAILQLRRARGQLSTLADIASGDRVGRVDFLGYDSTITASPFVSIARIEASVGGLAGSFTGQLRFSTSNTSETLVEGMRITQVAGQPVLRVGDALGTDNSNSLVEFHLQDTNNSSVVAALALVHDVTNTPAAGIGVRLEFVLEDSSAPAHAASIDAVLTDAGALEESDIVFNLSQSGSAPSEFMRFVGATGGIHIGTGATNPPTGGLRTEGQIVIESGGIDVTGSYAEPVLINTTTDQGLQELQVADASGGEMLLWRDDSTIVTDNPLGGIHFGGDEGSDFHIGAVISGIASQTWTGTAKGSYLWFTTTAEGTETRTERMRIAPDGGVHIGSGYTAPPTGGLRTEGQIIVESGGLTIGGDVVLSDDTTALIRLDTSNGSDSSRLVLAGGGDIGTTRGAYIAIAGNEFGGGEEGTINIFGGTDSADGGLKLWTDDAMRLSINFAGLTTLSAGLTVTGASTISGLTTVGALNSGSITSGFGNIDNGSSTLDTGALTATTANLSGNDLALQLSAPTTTGNPFMEFRQTTTRRSFIQHNDSGDNLILASEYGGISLRTGTGGTEVERFTISSGGAADFQSNTVAMGALTLSNFSSTAVSEGAVDSGGSGFKLLRVPN